MMTSLSVTAAVVQCVVIATATVGNALVIVAVFRFRRMRTVANYFISSLAAADLAVSVLVMPFSVVEGLTEVGWCFGETFCRLWISLDVTCCTASILHLCAIAVDRYLAVTRPLKYPSGSSWTGRRVAMAILTVWSCSTAISFVPINVGWYAVKVSPRHQNMSSSTTTMHKVVESSTNKLQCDLNANGPYAILSSMTSFYLPLVVMVTVYAKIFWIARCHTRRIRLLEASITPASPTAGIQFSKNWRAIKTLGTLMGLFIVCWLPFFAVYVVRPFVETADGSRQVPHNVIHVVTWLGYANSAINPFVYGLMSRDFRTAYSKLVLGCRSRRRVNCEHTTGVDETEAHRRTSCDELMTAASIKTSDVTEQQHLPITCSNHGDSRAATITVE